MTKSYRNIYIISLVFTIFAVFLINFKIFDSLAWGPNGESNTQFVIAKQLIEEDIKVKIPVFGNVSSADNVRILSPFNEEIAEIFIEDFASVSKGDKLFSLNTDRIKEKINQQKALLKGTKNEYERGKNLFSNAVISEAEFDILQSEYYAQLAGLKLLEIDLNKHIIRAPMNGKLTQKAISIGQRVSSNETLIELTNQDILHIQYFIPEKYRNLISVGDEIILQNLQDDKTIEVKLDVIDEKVKNMSIIGRSIVNSKDFSNLFSGQKISGNLYYVISNAITLPHSSLIPKGYKEFVHILEPENFKELEDYESSKYSKELGSVKESGYLEGSKNIKNLPQKYKVTRVKICCVITNTQEGVVIDKNGQIKAGDYIITEGLLKTRPGTIVQIKNLGDNR